jgi:hypothetical protein
MQRASVTILARSVFGVNSVSLAAMKRRLDPLNVLSCGCPLIDDETSGKDPRVLERGSIVVIAVDVARGRIGLQTLSNKHHRCGVSLRSYPAPFNLTSAF